MDDLRRAIARIPSRNPHLSANIICGAFFDELSTIYRDEAEIDRKRFFLHF